MKKTSYLGVALLFFSGLVWAGEDAEMVRPSMAASTLMTVSATVTSIDHATRIMTVQKDDGEYVTFNVPEEARNLGQVEVGDVVYAEYESVYSIEVMANEGYEAGAATVDAVARAEEGEMPGIAAMETTVITATVEDINIEANTFRLKGPEGNISEYVARNPDNLHRAKVGDLVVMTITESVAVTVEHVEE